MAVDLKLKLNAVFEVTGTTYTASMDLPTATPSAAAPFRFFITSEPTANVTAVTPDPTKRSNLVAIAVGGTDHVFVSVGPPTSLLADAGVDMVKQLNIQIQDGNYDLAKGTFS